MQSTITHNFIKIFLIFVLVIFSATIISAGTINVPADYGTIQAAVDAIAVLDGGGVNLTENWVIIIAGGAYNEDVLISGYDTSGGNITLQAGAGTPDINGNMRIEDDNVTIDGIWLHHNQSDVDGIHIRGHNVTIQNCKVYDVNNGSGTHDSIYVWDDMTGVIIINNIVDNGTLGIRTRGINTQIIGNEVLNCSGEGIRAGIVASGAVISGNTVHHNGQEGIHANASSGTVVDNNTVYENAGGGIHVNSTGSTASVNIVVQNNTVNNNGNYGIKINTSDNGGDLSGLIITGNTVTYNDTWGFEFSIGNSTTLDCSLIQNN